MPARVPAPKRHGFPPATFALLLWLAPLPLANGQTGPVAYWKFDEGTGTLAADSSGNGNNGMLVGAPTWVASVSGQALNIDGSQADYVNVPYSPSLGLADDFTIAAMVRRSSLTQYGAVIAKTDGLGNTLDYEVYFAPNEDGGQNLIHFWSNVTRKVSSTEGVTDTEWHHIAVTRVWDTMTFYLDGVEAGMGTAAGQLNNNAFPLRIGTDGPDWSATSMFEGSVDEVRLYDRALEPQEIQALLPATFSITAQPADVTQAVGFSARFSVAVSLTFGTTYQWYLGASPIDGATQATYTTPYLRATDNGSKYSVVVANAAGSSVTSRVATVTVLAPVLSPGFLKREVYANLPGTLVSDLTFSANYPDLPDDKTMVPGAETPSSFFGMGQFNYGQRVSGLLTPSESANYVFFIASFHQGELWLSTDESPDHKVLIATEPVQNTPRDWVGTNNRNPEAPENRSAPIALKAGSRYYIELLHKAGTGFGNLAVTAIKEGDALPANGSAPIGGTFVAAFGPLSGATVAFNNQPQSAVAAVGASVTLTADAASAATPVVYQWQKNGVDILKANEPTYTTPPLSLADDGAQYRCLAFVLGGQSATSQVATLRVSSDTTPPSLTHVQALADPATAEATQLLVRYSEPVERTSAETLSNYSVDGGAIAVSAAALQADRQRVVLTTAALNSGVDHTLLARGVRDASVGNVMAQTTRVFRTTHLVIHLPFDEGSGTAARDVSDGGNDGSLIDGPAWVAHPPFGSAVHIDGTKPGFVLVPYSPGLGIRDDFTMAVWVKRSALDYYGAFLAKTDGLGSLFDFELYFAPNEDGGQNFIHFWSDGRGKRSSTVRVRDTDWHHIAVTRAGETVTFYLDGTEGGTATAAGSLNNNPFPLRIGTDGPDWSINSMFEGSIDDVRIYNRALSADEVTALLQPPPTLSILRSGDNISLVWPVSYGGFALQRTDRLAPAAWTNVSEPPVVVDANYVVQLPLAGAGSYFRLIQ